MQNRTSYICITHIILLMVQKFQTTTVWMKKKTLQKKWGMIKLPTSTGDFSPDIFQHQIQESVASIHPSHSSSLVSPALTSCVKSKDEASRRMEQNAGKKKHTQRWIWLKGSWFWGTLWHRPPPQKKKWKGFLNGKRYTTHHPQQN